MRREAHQSIPIQQRRSNVAPFLQPSLSASSAVWPAASSHQQAFLFSFVRNATGVDKYDAAGLDVDSLWSAFDFPLLAKPMLLRLLRAHSRLHASDAAIRAARLSQRLEAVRQAVEPAIHTSAAPGP